MRSFVTSSPCLRHFVHFRAPAVHPGRQIAQALSFSPPQSDARAILVKGLGQRKQKSFLRPFEGPVCQEINTGGPHRLAPIEKTCTAERSA
jgi:hypothetical protein